MLFCGVMIIRLVGLGCLPDIFDNERYVFGVCLALSFLENIRTLPLLEVKIRCFRSVVDISEVWSPLSTNSGEQNVMGFVTTIQRYCQRFRIRIGLCDRASS